MHYYNDNDRFAAAWLRELIRDGLIPPGDVDERGIEEIRGGDLQGYTQCHFFAGVSGWSRALAIAGVPATEPLWTGSCPCQPFSTAGKRQGEKDERHLWPEFLRLIRECRPQTIFGEQVASAEVVGTELEAAFVIAVQGGNYARANKLAHKLFRSRSLHYWARWIDGIRADMEAEDYSVRFDVLGAHSAGAPHIRQRLFWVGVSNSARSQPWNQAAAPMGYGNSTFTASGDGGVADDGSTGLAGRPQQPARQERQAAERGGDTFWSDAIWHPCRDGKLRRIPAEPDVQSLVARCADRLGNCWDSIPSEVKKAIEEAMTLFPLAGTVPGRVGLLRGAGNGLTVPVAAEFIKCCMERSK